MGGLAQLRRELARGLAQLWVALADGAQGHVDALLHVDDVECLGIAVLPWRVLLAQLANDLASFSKD